MKIAGKFWVKIEDLYRSREGKFFGA